MGKKKFFYLSLFGGIVFLGLIALTVVIYVQRDKEEEVLSAEDVGITRISSEKIVSVRFDSLNPNYIGDCEDVSLISPLLDTAANAVYRPVKNPVKRRLSGFEMVYIETADHRYSIGYVNNTFGFGVDGDRKYYECSDWEVFIDQLCEIQDQWALNK